VKEVWEVACGEYSDRYTAAVCSSEEQANGVAVKVGGYVGGVTEFWEPEDGIPPYRPIYTAIVRPGRDSSQPVDVTIHTEPVDVDAPPPTPKVVPSSGGRAYPWARAENYTSADEAERDARAALTALLAAP
jgi:hypothetical protein